MVAILLVLVLALTAVAISHQFRLNQMQAELNDLHKTFAEYMRDHGVTVPWERESYVARPGRD